MGMGEGGRIDARCENSERSPPEGARRVIAMRRDVGNATVDKFKDKGRLRRYPGRPRADISLFPRLIYGADAIDSGERARTRISGRVWRVTKS